MSTIDDIKSRLDIVETVGGYVPELKKSGRTWKANCPFHQERTPSFVVDPGRGTWHCFGACSTGGDVISFVQRVENVEFREALRLCADRAGVELRPPSPREREQREQHERLLQANEAAALFYHAALDGPAGSEARDYVAQRGLDEQTLSTWQIGYAPDGWSGLLDHLLARGYSEQDVVDAGLASQRESGGAYDRFRHRLIFPTRDQRGRMIGFGARALRPDDEPKYLNTPQTPLFDKSGTLYGLDRAWDEARRADRIVVVEGYMDVIASHQFGIRNVVASMGTSITEKQMMLIKRYTPNVVLALDADNAGSEATLRGVEVAAGAADRTTVATIDWRGLVSYQDVLQADLRVASLPDGEDPDSLVRSDPDRFRQLIDDALPVADHLFQAVTDATDTEDARSRSRALQALAPTVSAMSDPVVRSHYVQKLARMARVDERTVLQAIARPGGRAARPRAVATPSEVQQAQQRQARGTPDGEQQLLALLLGRSECREAGIEIDAGTFEDSTNRRLFEAWCAVEEFEAREDELDEDVYERHEAIVALPLPDYRSDHLAEMVAGIAKELRLRRARGRLREAAIDHAEAMRTARLDGEPVVELAAKAVAAGALATGSIGEAERIASEFAETTQRQRALVRQGAAVRQDGDTGRGLAAAGDDPAGEDAR